MFIDFISNPLVLSVFFSVFIAQFIKFLLFKKEEGRWSWKALLRDAGMPSAHTATVTSLSIAVVWEEGVTTLSLVVLIFSMIIVRDVIGDKIFAEKQENIINEMVHKLQHMLKGHKVEWKHFIGHTINEVIAGFLLAVIVTVLIHYYL